MAHKRPTPKDTKPIDTDGIGYNARETEHGQSLPPAHPQRQRGFYGYAPIPLHAPNWSIPIVQTDSPERRTDLSPVRAKGILLRRIARYFAFGVLVGASVGIIAAWLAR